MFALDLVWVVDPYQATVLYERTSNSFFNACYNPVWKGYIFTSRLVAIAIFFILFTEIVVYPYS